ncbi:MAG TPA: P-II family nitrogen regulator [Chitinophagaceae bacterium]|nr:P-II family nitrogen regulator [Chitinophagaceae bacterium]
MKLILAIIRIAKINETKQALSDAGLPSFTAMGVLGRGRGRGLGPTYQKTLSDPEAKNCIVEIGPEPKLKSKRMINLIVTDDKKDLAVETILAVNKTGNSGDGKIIVLETLESVRVSTGERGNSTLD